VIVKHLAVRIFVENALISVLKFYGTISGFGPFGTVTLQVMLSKAHETASVVPVCRLFRFPAMSAQFTYEMCAHSRKLQKTLKLPILAVQGHLKSSMLTPLKSLLPVQYVCVHLQLFSR